MRGASLADLHLGFRAFSQQTRGRNTREVDVEEAWFAALRQIIEADAEAPLDLITIAGDVFHHPRVSDYAKRAFLVGVRMLLDNTSANLVVLQGNHDAGRTSDVLTPLLLAEGVVPDDERVAIITTPERIKIGDASVSCFPFVVREEPQVYKLEPDPQAATNVLVVHAAVRSDAGEALPFFYGGSASVDIGKEAERWDVIACGDFHEFRRLHPTRLAFYSGSLERTSSNIWQEDNPKGWVLWDTGTGTLDFRVVRGRMMVDMDAESGAFATADELNEFLAGVEPVPEFTGAMVRLKVSDFPLEERDHIDWALVRRIKSKTTAFHLDIRYKRAEEQALGDRRERGLSLVEEAVAFFAEDPENVRALALQYLDVEPEVEDLGEEDL